MDSFTHVDWNEYARDYDRERILGRHRLLFEHHQAVVQDFLSFFSAVDPHSRVLDVGCASGFFLTLLRELGFDNIEGADASEVFLARAREKGFNCRVFDILNPVVAGCERVYDVVLLMDTLEHLRDPLRALENTRTLFLKEDGLLFVTVPIYDSVYHRWKRLRRRQSRLEQSRDHDSTHVYAFSGKDARILIEKAGFTVLGARRLYCPLPFIPSRRTRAACNLYLPAWSRGMIFRVVARPAPAGS